MKWLNCNILFRDSNGMYAASITGDFLFITRALAASVKDKNITVENLEKLLDGDLIFFTPQLCEANTVISTYSNESFFEISFAEFQKNSFKSLFEMYSNFLNSVNPLFHKELVSLKNNLYNSREKLGAFNYET